MEIVSAVGARKRSKRDETNAFSAELALVQARLNELLALAQLYEALGGGWQQ